MNKAHSLDAEILYESPRVSSGKKSTSIHFRNDNKCLVCNREEKRLNDTGCLSCNCYSDRIASCSKSSYCSEINYKSKKKDISIHSNEFKCRECLHCYNITDEVPVRDEESMLFKRNNLEFEKGINDSTPAEINTERTKELQIIKENIEECNPKNMKLFTVFESESSNASNRKEKDKKLESLAVKNHSVELQTDESSTDASNEDFFNTLVNNTLQKLLSNSKHTFNEEEFDEFVDRHRLKCKCAIEKILQNMIDYNALSYSDESTSKEEEMASYNYRNKGISTDVETENTSATESNVDTKNITDLKVRNQPKILISAETKNLKEPHVADINKSNITYQEIIKELVKKCIEHDNVSEMSCTIEHCGSKQTSLTDSGDSKSLVTPHSTVKVKLSKHFHSDISDLKDSIDQNGKKTIEHSKSKQTSSTDSQDILNSESEVSPHNTVKVRLSKNFHSEISDHKDSIDQNGKKTIEHSKSKQTSSRDSQDILNSESQVSPHSTHTHTVKVRLSKNFNCDISDHKYSIDESSKTTKYQTEPNIPVKLPEKDTLNFKMEKNFFERTINYLDKSRKSLSENNLDRSNEDKWTEKEEEEKPSRIKKENESKIKTLELITVAPSTEVLLPVKPSYEKNNLHYEDSTNFEKTGFMSKFCMFFCKKFCRN